MSRLVEPLPAEGDQEEADAIVRRFPVQEPKYELVRVHVGALNVDYAPPHGSGYARPLSQGRLQRLRREWDPLAVGTLTLSRRKDNTLWVIDGNHRRVVAFEKGMLRLSAKVYSHLERPTEADLYTKLGTVFGQTPATRFQAKLIAQDPVALDITKIVSELGLAIDTVSTGNRGPGKIKAISRLEWIYARGGADGLAWVLSVLADAYDADQDSLNELVLEGCFGFWLRYRKEARIKFLVDRLAGAGITALDDRAATLFRRYATSPGNSIGRAMQEIYNQRLPSSIPKLGPWVEQVVGPEVKFSERGYAHEYRIDKANPAPQHLGE